MRNPRVYTVIPRNFQNNYDYALAAVKIDWKIYKKSVKNIKGLNKNPEIIKAALEQSEEVLQYLSPKIKNYTPKVKDNIIIINNHIYSLLLHLLV